MTTTEQAPTVIDEEEEELRDGALPAILGDGLPSPAAMKADMITRMREHVTKARTDRGPVRMQEDTFPLLRSLGSAASWLGDYGRAIRALELEARGIAEEETGEAIGYDDYVVTTKSWRGDFVPASNLVVPDEDGDWHITREFATEADVDWHSLASVQARLSAAHACAGHVEDCPTITGDPDRADDDCGLSWAAVEALVYSVSQQTAEDTLDALMFLLSSPKPKTTALKAWAKQLSAKGLDDLASIVRSSWSSTRAYRGVKLERS